MQLHATQTYHHNSPQSARCLTHERVHRNLNNSRVSVVIPTRNEARNLPAVLDRLPDGLFEVIIVDGGSTDGTVEVARSLRRDVRIIEQSGTGKGNALATGLSQARGDILVTLDADGSTDPAEIPRFVSALVAGADMVKGSRFAPGGGSADITRSRRLGNRALCTLVNRIYGTSYTDLCYGFNAFWADCLGVLQSPRPMFAAQEEDDSPFGRGFEVETVLNVRAAKAGLRVWEVPSYELRRIYGTSNLHALRDGLRVVGRIWTESPALSARYTGSMAAPAEAVSGLLPLPAAHEPREAGVLVPAQREPSAAELLASPEPAAVPASRNGNGNGNGHRTSDR